jgi:hypothetical protein
MSLITTNFNFTTNSTNLDSKSYEDSECIINCDIWSDEFWSVDNNYDNDDYRESSYSSEFSSNFSSNNENPERQLEYVNDYTAAHDLQQVKNEEDYRKKRYCSSDDESDSEYPESSSTDKVKTTFYDESGCEIDVSEFLKTFFKNNPK